MKRIGSVVALGLTAVLTLTGCNDDSDSTGSDDGQSMTQEDAEALVVDFGQRVADGDYEGACALIEPTRRAADTCPASVEQMSNDHPGEASALTAETLIVLETPPEGCVYKLGKGDVPLIGSAIVVWSTADESWWINSLGNMDGDAFTGEMIDDYPGRIKEYECPL